MSRKKNNNYREVTKLPKSALTVSAYATEREVTSQYLYNLWKKHIIDGKEIDFEIVLFQNINWIIPKH